MLAPDERYYRWEDLKELIEKLISRVEDEIVCTYSPYGKKQDADTPFVQFLLNSLVGLNDYTEKHAQVLWKQFCEWEDENEEEHLDEVLSDALSWQFPCLHDVGGVLFV